jgi:hypothetical protein
MLDVPYMDDGSSVEDHDHEWIYIATDHYEGNTEYIYRCLGCRAKVYTRDKKI